MKPSLTLLLLSLAPLAAGASTAENEAILARACASPAPVLVVDTFGAEYADQFNIDIDGDGTYDMLHGDFVARLAELNGQATVREGASVRGPMGMTIYPAKLAEILNRYADKIERGEARISWVNFSQGFTSEFKDLNRLLGYRNVINDKNVDQYAGQILAALYAKKTQAPLKALAAAIERITRLGIPVVAAAANDGYNAVNIYSLFPGVISVGALDLAGRSAWYSADNSLVSIWRRGSVVAMAAPGGIDLNGDGSADFSLPTREFSAELLAQFEGRAASAAASEIPTDLANTIDDNTADFFSITANLPAGLYETNGVLRHARGTSFQQSHYLAGLGDYFYLDGQDGRPLFFLGVNNAGDLVRKKGMESYGAGYRNELYGTSFASPNICNGQTTPPEYAR